MSLSESDSDTDSSAMLSSPSQQSFSSDLDIFNTPFENALKIIIPSNVFITSQMIIKKLKKILDNNHPAEIDSVSEFHSSQILVVMFKSKPVLIYDTIQISQQFIKFYDGTERFRKNLLALEVKLKFHWLPPNFQVEKVKTFLISRFSLINIIEAGNEFHQPPLDKIKNGVIYFKVEYDLQDYESIRELVGIQLIDGFRCLVELFWKTPECNNFNIPIDIDSEDDDMEVDIHNTNR